MPESPDRDAAKDHKESLAMNAKCEADVFVSMSALKVKRTTAAGAISTAAQRKNATQAVVNCIKGAIADGKDYHDLTWYQIQYSIIYSSTPYVSADVAKAEIEKYDALMNLIK